MNQHENNNETPTKSRRLSLDSGMDRLCGKRMGVVTADGSNQRAFPHRFMDGQLNLSISINNSNNTNNNTNNNNININTSHRQRRRMQAARAEADLLLAGTNVEITGLELLMMCDDELNNDSFYCSNKQQGTELDYYDDVVDDDDSISMVSYEVSCSSMDSIANDSIDLARERQQRQWVQKNQTRSHSISLLSAPDEEDRISYHRLECHSSDSCKISSDSGSMSSKSVYSILLSEQMMQDFSETVTINTGGTNRAA